MVSRVQMAFYILTKGCTVPGNQSTHDKNRIGLQNLPVQSMTVFQKKVYC